MGLTQETAPTEDHPVLNNLVAGSLTRMGATHNFSIGAADPSVVLSALSTLVANVERKEDLGKVALANIGGAVGSIFGQAAETEGRYLAGKVANIPYDLAAMTLTAGYGKLINRIDALFDVGGFNRFADEFGSLQTNRELFQFTTVDEYPPYLQTIPPKLDLELWQIFDPEQLGSITVTKLEAALQKILPAFIFNALQKLAQVIPHSDVNILNFDLGNSIAETEKKFLQNGDDKNSIWACETILSRPNLDWYTDAVFAQQQFTGANPATIKIAPALGSATSPTLTDEFLTAAIKQDQGAVKSIIEEGNADRSLYLQDCSYIRQYAGATETENVSVSGALPRFACFSVTLFRLFPDGKLHPLAIAIDYKGSMDKSVVIFNKRSKPSDPTSGEASDWPWRYAKMCAQSADWIQHELGVHLTRTHLIEEAIIVASYRTLPDKHLIFRLLNPHWYKTLPLNAGARHNLIPEVIVPICGLSLDQAKMFIREDFANFDWQQNYVPEDLETRGFPLKQLGNELCSCSKDCPALERQQCQQQCGDTCHQPCDPKFHNYTYARNVKIMWEVLRNYTKDYLSYGGKPEGFNSDADVQNDKYIRNWCDEIQTSGWIKTFPTINTLDELIDAVTMCIHIAAVQHTAVNYLQEYNLAFVMNRPPALCTPLPSSLTELNKLTEKDVFAATQAKRASEWLLASHVPILLSMKVPEANNLITYARSVAAASPDHCLKVAAADLAEKLDRIGNSIDPKTGAEKKGIFQIQSDQLDDQGTPYMVLDPAVTAKSILI